jgi:DNA replication licensing factor MCM6
VRSAKDKNALTAVHDTFETGDIEEIEKQFKPDELQEIRQMQQDRNIYQKLVTSIAPHVFGGCSPLYLKHLKYSTAFRS